MTVGLPSPVTTAEQAKCGEVLSACVSISQTGSCACVVSLESFPCCPVYLLVLAVPTLILTSVSMPPVPPSHLRARCANISNNSSSSSSSRARYPMQKIVNPQVSVEGGTADLLHWTGMKYCASIYCWHGYPRTGVLSAPC